MLSENYAIPVFNLTLIWIWIFLIYDIYRRKRKDTIPKPLFFDLGEPNWKAAHKDCTCVGCYDETLQTSAFYYFKQVLIAGYRKSKLMETINLLHTWRELYAIDDKRYIQSAIEVAYDEVVKAISEAEQSESSPEFHVSNKYDWHQIPVKFVCNDHFPYRLIIEQLNALLDCTGCAMLGTVELN